MKVLIIFLLFMQVSIAKFQPQGLSQKVFLRQLMYENTPLKRNVFSSAGHRNKYKTKVKKQIRSQLTLIMPKIKENFDNYRALLPILEYNPVLKNEYLVDGKFEKAASLSYPINLKFVINKTKRNLDFAYITLKDKPNINMLKKYIGDVRKILLTKSKKKTIIRSNIKKSMSPEKQEMLEVIRDKELKYNIINKYFGLYMHSVLFIESSYFYDVKKIFELNFGVMERKFKTEFMRSKNINLAIKSNLILSLEDAFEKNGFKSMREPFEISKKKLPKGFIRNEHVLEENLISVLYFENNAMGSTKNAISKILRSIRD